MIMIMMMLMMMMMMMTLLVMMMTTIMKKLLVDFCPDSNLTLRRYRSIARKSQKTNNTIRSVYFC